MNLSQAQSLALTASTARDATLSTANIGPLYNALVAQFRRTSSAVALTKRLLYQTDAMSFAVAPYGSWIRTPPPV